MFSETRTIGDYKTVTYLQHLNSDLEIPEKFPHLPTYLVSWMTLNKRFVSWGKCMLLNTMHIYTLNFLRWQSRKVYTPLRYHNYCKRSTIHPVKNKACIPVTVSFQLTCTWES